MDTTTLTLTVVNSILLLSPLAFCVILFLCLLVVLIKYITLIATKKKESVSLTLGEKQTFFKRFVFIFMAFPMVILSTVAQSAFIAIVIELENITGYLISLNFVFVFSFACSFYICLLMLYISFLLMSTLKQIGRISRFEFLCWNVIVVASLATYFISCVVSIIASGLSASTAPLPGYTKTDRNAFKTFALIINYVTFWISYWICTLVLAAGIRFYLLIVSYSKKIANQMIVFLSMLIIAALVQSFAVLLPSFSTLHDFFVVIPLWIQRISEIFFMIAFLLMYIPISSVGKSTVTLARGVIATMEKIGNLNKKHKEEESSSISNTEIKPIEEIPYPPPTSTT